MDFRMFRFNDIVISSGKGKMEYGFLLTEKPNTDSGNITCNEKNYIDTDGADYGDIYFAPRDFDIKGAILARNNAEKNRLRQRLIAACNPKQTIELFYNNGFQKFYAPAMTTALPEFGEEMPGILPFIIPMRIPGFYWLSEGEEKNNIFIRTKEIKNTFQLPMKFSTRQSEASIYNYGDVATAPIFKIVCQEKSSLSQIKLENTTTEKQICLQYQVEQDDGETGVNETITIDCENCSVTSSKNGNILNCITADSEFFLLEVGCNDIKCTLPGAIVSSTHRHRYLGG